LLAAPEPITFTTTTDKAMSYIGTVENGVVKLPPEAKGLEGERVRVDPLPKIVARNERTRRLLEIAAKVHGLPEDFAEQHDHYIHGTPKRPPSE
jgi:hypothetical protein